MVLLSELKVADYDQYIRGLFLPVEKRVRFMAYAGFAAEVARIPHSVKEPQLALIKLAWWREVLEEMEAGKPPRPHPVLQALATLQPIDYKALKQVIAVAEQAAEAPPPADKEQLLAALLAQAQALESLLLGHHISPEKALAIGITGYLKRVFPLARSGISPFPAAEVNPDQMGSTAYKHAAIAFTTQLVEVAWKEAGPVERFYLKRARANGYNLLQQDIRANLGLSYFFAQLQQKVYNML